MTATPAAPTASPLAAYLRRALPIALVGWVLFVLIPPLGRLVFAAPTAALLRALLAAGGNTVAGSGATVQLFELPARELVPAWTAAPVFCLALAAILPYPTTVAKKVVGSVQLLVHTVMINVMMLGWLELRADADFDYFSGQLRLLYPPLMTAVLLVSLLFWMVRVVPRPLLGKLDHTQAPAT